MKIVLYILLIFNSSRTAFAETCAHRIVFLPQTHATDNEIFGSTKKEDLNTDEVVESQFKIAKYIEASANVPIFSEQAVSRTQIWSRFPENAKAKARSIALEAFPSGLPNSISELTDFQRSKLNEIDAASLQLIREKIPAIYGVLPRSKRDTVFKPIREWVQKNPGKPFSPEIKNLIYDTREKSALQEINTFFSENPSQRDVILIYGSNHNFSIYPELFDPKCIMIPFDFQKKWYGKNRGGGYFPIEPFTPSALQSQSRIR